MMKKIGELEINDKSKLVLSLGEYKNQDRVDLRMYVKSKNENKEIPTKKGIYFDQEWLPDFVKMVRKLEKE